jgi:uncharacterized RDD family membrane protein YckC
LLGLKVVDLNGERLSFSRSLKRRFYYDLPHIVIVVASPIVWFWVMNMLGVGGWQGGGGFLVGLLPLGGLMYFVIGAMIWYCAWFFLIFVNKKKMGVYEKLSKTKVVEDDS